VKALEDTAKGVDEAGFQKSFERFSKDRLGMTLGDIEHTEAKGDYATAEFKTRVSSLVDRLEALASRSRKQSLSVLVPMGQEMAYRYQEGVIYETIAVLAAALAAFRPADAAAHDAVFPSMPDMDDHRTVPRSRRRRFVTFGRCCRVRKIDGIEPAIA